MAYIIVSVSFHCPSCDRTSVEHMVAETEKFDREQMARVLSQQPYECQFCLRTLPDGTRGNAHAEVATPNRLKKLGFPAPRIN
jgi:hypothetical protein